jgi:hypothetical protein
MAAGERHRVEGPIDHAAVRETLDFHLTTVLRGRATIAWFAAWWERAATTGLLDHLTVEVGLPARNAVDLCQPALDDYRAGRIGDEDLLDLLLLAREALRG